jgi:hypothetical protein
MQFLVLDATGLVRLDYQFIEPADRVPGDAA